MKLRIFQKGFNYSQDGPGNRLVYHLQGCNMRCPWCSNPEGIAIQGALIANKEYLYNDLCPYGAINEQRIDYNLCNGCLKRDCIEKPNNAMHLSYKEYSVDDIVNEVIASEPLMIDGGGVTFTGGEATCQFNTLKEILVQLKEHNISTAIETNATHPAIMEIVPFISVIMMDVKHWDEDTHRKITGIGLTQIRRNMMNMLESGVTLQIRIPLIDGFNASQKDIDGFVDFFKTLPLGESTIEYLPYHEYGRDKWATCGMEYKMVGGHISKETLNLFQTISEKNHLHVIRT